MQTSFEDAKLFVPAVHPDQRGFFQRVFSQDEYAAAGLNETFVEDNLSSSRRGVVRGLHYDFRLAKLVQVIYGRVFDVIVDVRRNSPGFGRWQSFELSAQNHHQLLVPRGFAHGFLAQSDEAIVLYKQTAAYDPAHEGQVLWNDPDIGIDWPLETEPVLSDKDRAAPSLSSVGRFDQ